MNCILKNKDLKYSTCEICSKSLMTCLRESESENVKLKKELKCYSEQTLRLIYRDKDFNKKTVGGTSYELEREIDKLITGEYR